MGFLKEFFLSASLAGLIAPLISHAADTLPITPTPAEGKVITYMKDHGTNHFLMLNKERGQILYVINNQITGSDSALSGKIKGDNARKDLGVTPSGIFELKSWDNTDSIGFKHVKEPVNGKTIYYTIHPVIDVKGQQRLERLESMRPEWKNISAGCVNVSMQTIGRIHGLMTMPQTFKDDQSTQQVTGTLFVVLPKSKPVESILKYPELKMP